MSLSREVLNGRPRVSWWTTKNRALWAAMLRARIPKMVLLVTPTVGNQGSTSSMIMKARKNRDDLKNPKR